MVLNGKKMVFLGDSITEGFGVREYKNVYHQVIKELYGCKECINCGISGTAIARAKKPNLDYPRFDISFGLRVPVMPKDIDIVCVLGGGNDFAKGDAYFGDESSMDPYTFNGALNCLYRDLKEKYEGKQIVILTPLPTPLTDFKSYPEGHLYEDYVNCIIKAAKRNNLACIDLFHYPVFPSWNRELMPDGCHPNDKGSRLLGEYIGRRLLEI